MALEYLEGQICGIASSQPRVSTKPCGFCLLSRRRSRKRINTVFSIETSSPRMF